MDRCVVGLGQLGAVQLGDRVCVFLPNCIEFPLAFLAVLRLGAVFLPVNPAYTKCTLRVVTCIQYSEGCVH